MSKSKTIRRWPFARWLIFAGLVAMAVVGCVQWREFATPTAPEVTPEWRALIDDLRAFESKIAYQATKNFQSLTTERETYPFCGHSSKYRLPYSYEDPAIQWFENATEADCLAVGSDIDVYYGSVEALGEIGTPVTPAMVGGKLDRFVYLVIHEDCHDQFDLPYGIEEALCNVLAYHAMEAFARQKFRWYSRENRAIRNYAGIQARESRAIVRHYLDLEALYGRYQKHQITTGILMQERARIFAEAEAALALERGVLNNVVLANLMTYSRHYPYLETVYEALGRDLAASVVFFRRVDEIKPTRAEVMKRLAIKDDRSLEFVRAYEAAVIETATRALAQRRSAAR